MLLAGPRRTRIRNSIVNSPRVVCGVHFFRTVCGGYFRYRGDFSRHRGIFTSVTCGSRRAIFAGHRKPSTLADFLVAFCIHHDLGKLRLVPGSHPRKKPIVNTTAERSRKRSQKRSILVVSYRRGKSARRGSLDRQKEPTTTTTTATT